MTSPPHSTKLLDALVLAEMAADCFVAAQHFGVPSEAEEGAELAIRALDNMPKELAARVADHVACTRNAASELATTLADLSVRWNADLHYRCEAMRMALDAICCEIRPPTPPQRARKPDTPTLASVAKQASKAGIEIARYETKPDGTIVADVGKGEQQQRNEVDEWIAKHADKTQRH